MPHFSQVWKDKDEANGVNGTSLEAASFSRVHPSVNALHAQFIQPTAQKRGFCLKGETALKVIYQGTHYVCGIPSDLLLDARDLLDEDADLIAGRDYYIYACYDDSDPLDVGLTVKVSLNSTYPTGWDEQSSRKIGGFHTLCADVGSITGHPLSGYSACDILPHSFWCLTHRPWPCGPEGMVYVPELAIWVDIYLQSGTGTLTQSVYGATITDTRTWDDHNDDFAAVGKKMVSDIEFSIAMEGSNQQTAIKGAADPVTTGGHEDTNGRRMISNYGIEDGCGATWQWCGDGPASQAASPASFAPYAGKGAIYGTIYALLAGGSWSAATSCGSRCRCAHNGRSSTNAAHGGRGRARSRV